MFNLAEILTLIIGLLLGLVFVDGVRKSLRTKKNKLKVDIKNNSLENKELENLESESDDKNTFFEEDKEITEREIPVLTEHNLLIFNLSSEDPQAFSHSSLSERLISYRFFFEEKGFFTFRDIDDSVMFSLLNAKNPGTFLGNTCSPDIALVLDPNKSKNVVEAFELMSSLAELLSQIFSCSLLDESRNILTKQMLEHMRNETQEYQRQHLSNVS